MDGERLLGDECVGFLLVLAAFAVTEASSRLRSLTRANASATVLFDFQLPAMISLRSLFI